MLGKLAVDKTIPVPIYYQLKKAILGLIEAGALQEGDMLPPESAIAAHFSISRPTVRQAMGELVAEGYLSRKKGLGTFVCKPKVDARFLSRLESFNQEMLQKGLTPSTRVLRLEKAPAKADVNERLGLSMEEPLLYLERLRAADGVALVYLETWVPCAPFEKLMGVDFTANSLYESLEKLYGVRVNRVSRDIEAVNARQKEAQLLAVAPGKALCLVRTVATAAGHPLPVEYSVARYRGDMNRFHVELER